MREEFVLGWRHLEKIVINTTPSQPIGVDGPLRKCAKCERTKPLSEFGKFHRGPGGYNHKCKECCKAQGKAWRDANKEKEAARCREWRKANPEKRKEVVKAWNDANKPAKAAYSAEYHRRNADVIAKKSKLNYVKNKSKIQATNKRWADRNPEKVREKGRAWGRRNPDKINAKCSRRRARLSAVEWADKKAIAKVYRAARELSKSTGRSHQVDHVYPLNGLTVSGLHVPENLMVVDTWTNRSKHNKLPGHLAHELWDPNGRDVYYPESQYA